MSIVEAEHPAGVPVSVAVEIGGKEISFETGKLAKQADGAVVVRSGETVVLGTAQGRTEAREGADFFPLTVDVEERMYAAGKIPGGFFKREGRPTERAILTARMTDRPVRPLWPKGYRNEVQCVATVLLGGPRRRPRRPRDQRRLGRADRVAAALPRPDRRRADGAAGGRARRQPDARGDRALVRARPDRRRDEGRADHGRGRREPGARDEAARGARDCAARDRQALRGAGGAPCQGREAEVARPGDDRAARADLRARDLVAHPRAGHPRGGPDRRGHRRQGGGGALDDLDRRRRPPRAADPHVARDDPREAALDRGRGPGARAVRESTCAG